MVLARESRDISNKELYQLILEVNNKLETMQKMIKPNQSESLAGIQSSTIELKFPTSIINQLSDIEWLMDQLPRKPLSFNLLFSSERHGFKCRDWGKSVVEKGPTITLFKTTKQKVCGGYLNIPW